MPQSLVKWFVKTFTISIIVLVGVIGPFSLWGKAMRIHGQTQVIELSKPKTDGHVSLEATLKNRRSVRTFKKTPVSLTALSQLLWAAQGVTHYSGFRTAPSAGALYPLEVYVVAGNVEDLVAGIYLYRPHEHVLVQIAQGDHREALSMAALWQKAISHAPVVFVIAGVSERTTGKYGERGIRYVYMEAGHAAQNLCLQAVALGLGSVVIGAFSDHKIGNILKLGKEGMPLYIIPVGKGTKNQP